MGLLRVKLENNNLKTFRLIVRPNLDYNYYFFLEFNVDSPDINIMRHC
jgi:hypothetical protein